jgi:hypothetical protein
MSVLDTILTRLRDGLGLSSEQAAGVAGNLQVESGLSSTSFNLRAAGDAGSAAAAFDQYYERSSGSARAQRVADAQAIASGRPSFAGLAASAGAAAGRAAAGKSMAASLDTGLLTGWAPAAFTIGLKVLGVAAAAGLVIVGAVHTVSK